MQATISLLDQYYQRCQKRQASGSLVNVSPIPKTVVHFLLDMSHDLAASAAFL